jgi:hypothetical protein
LKKFLQKRLLRFVHVSLLRESEAHNEEFLVSSAKFDFSRLHYFSRAATSFPYGCQLEVTAFHGCQYDIKKASQGQNWPVKKPNSLCKPSTHGLDKKEAELSGL